MKRPSFQFYPDDWTGNSNLRRCTHEEKGIWMDVLCILHDQEEYGIARWPLSELAQAVGTTKEKLKRLVDKGVLKGVDTGKVCKPFIFVPRSGRKDGDPITLIAAENGPLWYSSRMVTDEYKRQVRGGTESSPNGTPDPSPKYPIGDGIDAAPKEAPKQAPKGTPDPSPFTCAPGQAPRAAPSSPSPSPIKPSVSTDVDTDGKPSDHPVDKSPDEMTRDELWQAGKSLLQQAGMPQKQCGSYVGKLVKDYRPEVVVDAVRIAVVERPADPASFLKATCQRIAGERKPAKNVATAFDQGMANAAEAKRQIFGGSHAAA